MISPMHTLEPADMSLKMKKMGADSICIKDMAGLLGPVQAHKLVKAVKRKTSLPVQSIPTTQAAWPPWLIIASVLAGADVVDCAISPFAMGPASLPRRRWWRPSRGRTSRPA